MRTLIKLVFILLFAFAAVLGSQWQEKPSLADSKITRLWGQTQYETAKAIAEQVNPEPQSVVLASGNGFADALAASVLAHQLDAPILLVERSPAQSGEAMGFIAQHLKSGGTVWLVGGPAVIHPDFEQQLRDRNYTVKRIAGYDQYETAALVAQTLGVSKGTPVVIASGENFPDALSFSSIAAYRGWPILLVPHNGLPDHVKNYLSTYHPAQVYIAGGTGAIRSEVEAAIRQTDPAAGIRRFAGYDQFDTTALILEEFTPVPDRLYLASGIQFADALAGSALAAQTGAPIMLVDPKQSTVPQAYAAYLSKLKEQDIIIFGGDKAVPPLLAYEVGQGMGRPAADPAAKDGTFQFGSLSIGSPLAEVLDLYGQPQRKDISEYGFEWYIYNLDYHNYMQIGIKNGIVVGLYSGVDQWQSPQGSLIGTGRSQIDRWLTLSDRQIGVPDEKEYRTYRGEGSYATIFYDVLGDNQAVAVLLLDKATVDAQRAYYGSASSELKASFEQELFDLTNVARVGQGLNALVWDSTIANTAWKHCADMAKNDYFDHYNLKGLSPFDRMTADGIKYSYAGENLAAGQTNAIFAHQGLMNSAGHRENILLKEYTRLGVGVAFGGKNSVYYGENFYTPLNGH